MQAEQKEKIAWFRQLMNSVKMMLGFVVDTSRKEFAAEIRAFVDGTSGEWDWDDLTSVAQRDPVLEAIRKKLINVHDDFPANEPGHYCNDEGMKEMLRIADYLDPLANKNSGKSKEDEGRESL